MAASREEEEDGIAPFQRYTRFDRLCWLALIHYAENADWPKLDSRYLDCLGDMARGLLGQLEDGEELRLADPVHGAAKWKKLLNCIPD